jgi:hypothetical protein
MYELEFYTPDDDILHSDCRENLKSYFINLSATCRCGFLSNSYVSLAYPATPVPHLLILSHRTGLRDKTMHLTHRS